MPIIMSPIRVLVVEDETFIRMDAVEMLCAARFHILEAANAGEAVQMLERDSDIRLMLRDINMPGLMDDLKSAAAVWERWPPVRIIATSAHFKVQAGDLQADARARNRSPDPVVACCFGRVVPSDAKRDSSFAS